VLGRRGPANTLSKYLQTSKENCWTTWVAVLLVLNIVKFVGAVSSVH
jgi:hypothetical protein